MSGREKKYTPDFKAKVVIELLSGELTLSQASSKYGITPKHVQEWKETFISNASLVFDLDRVASGHIATEESEVGELSEYDISPSVRIVVTPKIRAL